MSLSPASTFKIPNTLIALNEGTVNANSIILWDKTDKGMEPWNKNQTLESAFLKYHVFGVIKNLLLK